MARGNRFGVFGGVFTPSVLTILGVIMYMRLPRIVGEGGLWMTLGIILAAHVISVTTGLSVASIATDKKVRAGGPYYIVSRSLGLPIGGTLGLALYVGLSFSVSLYVIGFAESLLPLLGYSPKDMDAIRVAGSLTLLVVTIVTLVSTSFALKIQYVIMAAIAVSLVGIFFGSHELGPVAGPALEPMDSGRSVSVLFGIFFPAVTGFTAGVNMSGDLKDPKRALPLGTIAAIAVGLTAYVGLAVFLAYTIDREHLLGADVLLETAVAPWMVFAGIWGATLSSAIGSILGAPRILQAKSLDRLTPEIFARGRGKANEPRNALLLTFAIAEAGILIGELDVIASIVSMFFIMTYGFLNLSCAFESWVSPDFRPEFRIPIWVSILGALAAVIVMVQLNFLAMIAATLLLLGLFLHFRRRELRLEAGDTWGGVWSSLVRSGLRRLEQNDDHHRNWRPNVMVFSERDAPSRGPLLSFTNTLMAGRGIITDFELVPGDGDHQAIPHVVGASEPAPPVDARTGFFHRPTPTDDVYRTMEAVCRFYGFSGVEPNTVVVDWYAHHHAADGFASLLDSVRARDLNLIVLGHDPERSFGAQRRIDVWTGPGGADMSLALALIRHISAAPDWRRCELSFVIAAEDPAHADRLHQQTQRVLDDNRILARVVVTHLPDHDALEERMHQESGAADLIIASLPTTRRRTPSEWIARTEALIRATSGSLLLIQASRRFDSTFRLDAGFSLPQAKATVRLAAPTSPEEARPALPPLRLPTHPELEPEATRFATAVEGAFEALHERALTPLYGHQRALVERLAESVKRHLDGLARTVATDAPAPRRKKAIARAQSGIIFQARKALDELERDDLPAMRDLFGAAVERWNTAIAELEREAPRRIRVERDRAEVAKSPEDSGPLRRFKWRRRFGAWIGRRAPRIEVRPTALYPAYLVDRGGASTHRAFERFAASSQRLVSELVRHQTGVAARLSSLEELAREGGDLAAALAEEQERAVAELDALTAAIDDELASEVLATRATGRDLAQGYCDDLDRLDVARFARRERRVSRSARARAEQLAELPAQWLTTETLLVHRGEITLDMAGYQRRLSVIVERTLNQLRGRLQRDLVTPYEELLAELKTFREAVRAGRPETLSVSHTFKSRVELGGVMDALVQETQKATLELPASVEVVANDALAQLEAHPLEEVEGAPVGLQRVVEFIVDAELVGELAESTNAIPEHERRAHRVGRDVVRLVSYSASDLIAADVEVVDEDARAQLLPLLDSGIARVGAELEILRGLHPALGERVAKRLATIRERTGTWAIAGATEAIKRYTKRRRGRVATAFGQAARGIGELFRGAVVGLVYRRSRGVLLARRLKPGVRAGDAVVDRALELTRACTPAPELLGELPFYYRQLFLGRSASDHTFWVGREGELARAARAVENHRAGYSGALVVVGDGGSGKSALAQLVVRSHFDHERIFKLVPPAGGSIDPEVFAERVQDALQVRGTLEEVLRTLPEGSALVVEDAELWWERSAEGLAVIDVLLDAIERHGDRCLFVLDLNTRAFRAIDRFRALARRALAVLECGPVDSRTLQEMMELRHGSTGFSWELEGRPSEGLGDWRRARFYAGHFDASRGLVGPALQGWLVHAGELRGETLVMRQPRAVDDGVLDELDVSQLALLVQLVLHKSLTLTRLSRVMGLPRERVDAEVGALARMGLVIREGEDALGLNRYVQHHVTRSLEDRGMLP